MASIIVPDIDPLADPFIVQPAALTTLNGDGSAQIVDFTGATIKRASSFASIVAGQISLSKSGTYKVSFFGDFFNPAATLIAGVKTTGLVVNAQVGKGQVFGNYGFNLGGGYAGQGTQRIIVLTASGMGAGFNWVYTDEFFLTVLPNQAPCLLFLAASSSGPYTQIFSSVTVEQIATT